MNSQLAQKEFPPFKTYKLFQVIPVHLSSEIPSTVPRQRLTHFVCAQNLKNVSIFGVPIFDCIFPTFLGPKIDIFQFREPFRKDIFRDKP